MPKPQRPIQINLHVNFVLGNYYPYLTFTFYNELHPESFECKTPYPTKKEAMEEAARMTCAFLEANKALQDLISIEIYEDGQEVQFAEDGSYLN